MSERLKIGEGRISAALSLFLSLVGLGAVLCFHFPELLTTAEFRAHYPVELLRVVLLICLVLLLLLWPAPVLELAEKAVGLVGDGR